MKKIDKLKGILQQKLNAMPDIMQACCMESFYWSIEEMSKNKMTQKDWEIFEKDTGCKRFYIPTYTSDVISKLVDEACTKDEVNLCAITEYAIYWVNGFIKGTKTKI